MKIIQHLNCLAPEDDFAKEVSFGRIFNEIKDHNINSDILKHPARINCSGSLYITEKIHSHNNTWGITKDLNLRNIFHKDEALMLLNKAALPFLDTENREIIIYLQNRLYYLVAESFLRKEEGLVKRILLCKVNPSYQHPKGTGLIIT